MAELAVPQVAEGDGVAERAHRGDAVLPLGARRPAQEINGARPYREIAPLPAMTCFQAETEIAGGQKRDTDDVSEYRAVLMPAYGSTRRVFSDQDLLETAGRESRQAFRPRAYRRKKVRHVFGL